MAGGDGVTTYEMMYPKLANGELIATADRLVSYTPHTQLLHSQGFIEGAEGLLRLIQKMLDVHTKADGFILQVMDFVLKMMGLWCTRRLRSRSKTRSRRLIFTAVTLMTWVKTSTFINGGTMRIDSWRRDSEGSRGGGRRPLGETLSGLGEGIVRRRGGHSKRH